MVFKIKIRLEKELRDYADNIDKTYSLNRLSPALSKNIKEFICRPGKRIRPILFCIGYLGFSQKTPAGLYRSAIALELLHDFLLVHDDIIDKSLLRRGRPSMHALLSQDFCQNKKTKFSGQDLAIVTGDIIYAMALDAFLSINENFLRKEAALKKFISSSIHTAGGEFIELILGNKPIEKINLKDIYKIYDFKTANYTFASPLTLGATLGGAEINQVKKIHAYGMLLGRAFQIKDDIIGIFGKENQTGKPSYTDIKEAKRTLLIYAAFNQANKKDKLAIKNILEADHVKKTDLATMQKIIIESGALSYAQNQIKYLYSQAIKQTSGLIMKRSYLQTLDSFCKKILLNEEI